MSLLNTQLVHIAFAAAGLADTIGSRFFTDKSSYLAELAGTKRRMSEV